MLKLELGRGPGQSLEYCQGWGSGLGGDVVPRAALPVLREVLDQERPADTEVLQCRE